MTILSGGIFFSQIHMLNTSQWLYAVEMIYFDEHRRHLWNKIIFQSWYSTPNHYRPPKYFLNNQRTKSSSIWKISSEDTKNWGLTDKTIITSQWPVKKKNSWIKIKETNLWGKVFGKQVKRSTKSSFNNWCTKTNLGHCAPPPPPKFNFS